MALSKHDLVKVFHATEQFIKTVRQREIDPILLDMQRQIESLKSRISEIENAYKDSR